MEELLAYEDPMHEGNSAKYLTGKRCIVEGCFRPAGTMWSPYWCFKHNVERIKKVNKQLRAFVVAEQKFWDQYERHVCENESLS